MRVCIAASFTRIRLAPVLFSRLPACSLTTTNDYDYERESLQKVPRRPFLSARTTGQ